MTAPCFGLHALFDAEDEASQQRAAAVCAGCQLRQACHDGAVERDEPQGTWGGRVFPVALLDGMPAAPVVEVAHSRAAYVANAHGDCARCRAANAAYRAQWLARPVVTDAPRFEQTAIDLGAAS